MKAATGSHLKAVEVLEIGVEIKFPGAGAVQDCAWILTGAVAKTDNKESSASRIRFIGI